MGYQPAQWHDLFEAIAGASAALAGLIFVAVSLNLRQILEGHALVSLAARSLAVLIGLVVMCAFGLTPGQPRVVLGAEILVLGIVLLAGALATTYRTMRSGEPQEGSGEPQDGKAGSPEVRTIWQIEHLSLALVSTLPMVVAGASILAGAGGGLYWVLVEIVCGLVASVLYAWVLLVEILR
jgi:type III secretory pathway component EscV